MTAPIFPTDIICKLTKECTKTTKNRLLKAQYGNGFIQIAKDGFNSNIDSWNLVIAPLDAGNITTMETFLSTVGCDVWFTWTPLGETVSKKWRIDQDSVKTELVNFVYKKYTMSITEAFDLGT